MEERKKIKRGTQIISGGEAGADYEWCLNAVACDYEVLIVSFHGHSRHVPSRCKIFELSRPMLSSLDPELDVVAKELKRAIPKSEHAKNLLRRNIFIAKDVEAVYAVGQLSAKGDVSGGTAWTCKYHTTFHPNPNLHLFDTNLKRWVKYHNQTWKEELPPSPADYTKCAMIGSRDLSDEGKLAIEDLFKF